MKEENLKNKANNESKPSHSGHLKMMIVCCGLPLLGLLILATVGIEVPSIKVLLLIACPVLMIAMMSMMRKKHDIPEHQSCCQTLVNKANSDHTISDEGINNQSCCSPDSKLVELQTTCCCSGGMPLDQQNEITNKTSIMNSMNS